MISSTLYQLLRDLSRRPLLIISLLIMIVAQVSLSLYLPLLLGQVIDHLLASDHQLLLNVLWQMFAVIVGNAFLLMVISVLSNKLVYAYSSYLRWQLMKKLHHLSLSQLDKHSVGDLLSRASADVEQLSNGLGMLFNQFVSALLLILLTLWHMLELDKGMLLLVLILTPLSAVVAGFIAKKTYNYAQEQVKARGQQTQWVEESFSQADLLQTFQAEEKAKTYFNQLNQIYASQALQATFYASTVNPATRFVNGLIYALVAGLGAYRIITNSFTIGNLMTFLAYVTQYTKPFNDLSSSLSELQTTLSCAQRIYEVLGERVVEKTTKTWSQPVKGEVIFHQVSFSYDKERPLLENLNLSVAAGSRVAIVGPTGAGKSTLINLLMRFYEPDEGQILLDGQPMEQFSKESLRDHVGLVMQETWLKEASIHDNIAYARPTASREEVVASAKAAGADFFIRQLPDGYDTVLVNNASQLSQGQRQLLTIARVFLKNPSLLILDEATSSVDTRTERLIQQALDKLMIGKTSFIIAHRLSTIEKADMILVMVAGKIVEMGRHDVLMAQKGFYYDLQTARQLM